MGEACWQNRLSPRKGCFTSNSSSLIRTSGHRFRWNSITRLCRGLCRIVRYTLICTTGLALFVLTFGFYHVYFGRNDLPDVAPLIRFEFPTMGHIYDTNGQILAQLAREPRRNSGYQEIPPVVCNAILAAEDKNFFSHSGVDYAALLRALVKVNVRGLVGSRRSPAQTSNANPSAMFSQGGSTITQQLVRGYFLQNLTSRENTDTLISASILPRMLSHVIGIRATNKLARKLEEIRLSLWLEQEIRKNFGSKRRAKEEILARYASFLYMGNGQYGFAQAAERYFGQPLAALTVDDADKAALLAGIAKSARYYAPTATDSLRVLHRRNKILSRMVARGFLSIEIARQAQQKPLRFLVSHEDKFVQAPAAVDHVLRELKQRGDDLSVEGLFQGRIQIYSTMDSRVQQIANEALEHGLKLYEKRHPSGQGLVQGSVVVMRNRDAAVLAEMGGRGYYKNRPNSYSDFNRATSSIRQAGSAMKPIVYLAAFRHGAFNLDSMVSDEPISVTDRAEGHLKWISNYDGQFKGTIPLRQALAESRNSVAVWITEQIGVEAVLRTARDLGVHTSLQPYITTALGASEVTLLELANAYRTMASGILAEPYVIKKVASASGEVLKEQSGSPFYLDDYSVSLIQEGLRSVVRMPTGTAHSLDSRSFPIAVMGKTGTTNKFRDALFVGSTYGPEGITVAVRIGFDNNRSLGPGETGGRVALPVFREIMSKVYGQNLMGPVPSFPTQIEQSITAYLTRGPEQIPSLADPSSMAAEQGSHPAPEMSAQDGLSATAHSSSPIYRTIDRHGNVVFTND